MKQKEYIRSVMSLDSMTPASSSYHIENDDT